MRPLSQLYWTRTGLGIVAGAISAGIAKAFPGNPSGSSFDQLSPFFNAITMALLIYIASYYFLKASYKDKLEKPGQVRTTAIGMYFFMWISDWVAQFA